jgi:hypothetical protein
MDLIAYEGTSALSGLYEKNGALDVAYAAEQWARSLANVVPDALVLALALATVLLLALRAYLRRQHKSCSTSGNVEELTEDR